MIWYFIRYKCWILFCWVCAPHDPIVSADEMINRLIDRSQWSNKESLRWSDQSVIISQRFFFCLFATFFILPVNIGFMRYFSKRFHHLPKLEIKFYWINFTYATYISSILFYGSVAAIYSSIAKRFYSRWILVIKEVFNYLQQKKSFTSGNVAKFYLGSMGKLVNAVMIGIC